MGVMGESEQGELQEEDEREEPAEEGSEPQVVAALVSMV